MGWLAINVSLLQRFLKALHADARRGFRSSRATPMRLQADGIVIALLLQRSELPHPVDDASAHWLPLVLAARLALHVFAVAMSDSLLGQQVVAGRIGDVAGEGPGIPRVPVQHE